MDPKKEAPPLPNYTPPKPKPYPVLSGERIAAAIETVCGGVAVAHHGQGAHKVFILPEAFQELTYLFSYGRKAPGNKCESKAIGYGHLFSDGSSNRYNLVVSHFIPIYTTNRSPIHVSELGSRGEYNFGLELHDYLREEYLKYEQERGLDACGKPVDPFLRCGPSEYVLEAHTHPDLGVFFSGTDRVTGAARAATRPICNFVCDPVRREMLGAVGSDFQPAEIIVYDRAVKLVNRDPVRKHAPIQLPPSADELVQSASRFLRRGENAGRIKIRRRLDGKLSICMKLVLPAGEVHRPAARSASEHTPAEQPSAEQHSAEQHSVEQHSVEQHSVEHASAEHASHDRDPQ